MIKTLIWKGHFCLFNIYFSCTTYTPYTYTFKNIIKGMLERIER